MPTITTVEDFIAMVEANQHVEAVERFYAPDATLQDNQSSELRGKDRQIENEKNKIEKGKVEKNIANTENVVKDQEEQIARLKFIIGEAQLEKVRQQKDYERWGGGSGPSDEIDEYESEYEEGMDGEEGWTNSDGDRLRDFGVDEDAEVLAEDDIPLGELLRRRKAKGKDL